MSTAIRNDPGSCRVPEVHVKVDKRKKEKKSKPHDGTSSDAQENNIPLTELTFKMQSD